MKIIEDKIKKNTLRVDDFKNVSSRGKIAKKQTNCFALLYINQPTFPNIFIFYLNI